MKRTHTLFSTATRLVISAAGLYLLWQASREVYAVAWGKGEWLGGFSPRLGPAFFGFSLFALLAGLALLAWLWLPAQLAGPLARLEERLAVLRHRLGWARWLLVLPLLLFPAWLLQFSYWGGVWTGIHLRLVLYLTMSLLTAALISPLPDRLARFSDLTAGLLLAAAAFNLAYAFDWASPYPFSISWSEGNRIWDFSILFGRARYDFPAGQSIPAYIDTGRQFLWGLAFLLPGVNIFLFRLWSGFLITLPYALLGWVAFQPTRQNRAVWLLAGLWTFLFITQGAIYTPLILCAILVAIAWRRPWWIAVPLILLAGYYAQITRFTWFIAPAAWAGLLVIGDLCSPPPPGKRWRWGELIAGVSAGLLGGFILPRLSGLAGLLSGPSRIDPGTAGPAAAGSSDLLSLEGLQYMLTRQPLLWDRLLPNPTYPPGIILGLLIAILPPVGLLIYMIASRRWRPDRLSGGLILALLLGFLGIGLIVSVKIGGGSNLHNLDLFLVSLLFTLALAWRAGGDEVFLHLDRQPAWVQGLLALNMVIFAYQALSEMRPLEIPDDKLVRNALEVIQEQVDENKANGDILFIDQRQLLTFGYIQDVPLVPDYEKKYMMDMAMEGKAEYFEPFYADLAAQRFSVIISEPLRDNFRGSEYHFGDENDAWVKWVSRPVLCYYKPLKTYREIQVQILVPRDSIEDCAAVLENQE